MPVQPTSFPYFARHPTPGGASFALDPIYVMTCAQRGVVPSAADYIAWLN